MTGPGSKKTGEVCCPSCNWSQEFQEKTTSKIAAFVDACLHWDDEHGGPVPDGATFGEHQCPECHAMHGLHGTVSCSECGHVPQEVRA
jgi:uncharacterized Zn finger protein (UPF0148 family)